MKHKRKIITVLLTALLLVVLLPTGCAKKDTAVPIGSKIWEEMPKLTYGVWEVEKLEVLPWNAGRCEATSYNMMAETENGYYLLYASWLWYADKDDLSNWVIVCNQPDCDHLNSDCYGHMSANCFIVKDDRIYYPATSSAVPQYRGKKCGRVMISMDGNGKNKKLAYAPEEAMISGEGSTPDYLMPNQWLVFSSELDTAGNLVTKGFRITEDGCQQFLSRNDGPEAFSILGAKNIYSAYGDQYFISNVLDETDTKIFRFEGDTLIERDTTGLPLRGSYFSGNTLRCFRPGDGYYDIDLTTGEEIYLADVRLDSSYSIIILPNCILESTLLYPVSTTERPEEMTHSIELFNGESWQSITLPNELKYAPDSFYITVQSVTSDGILLGCRDMKTAYSTTGTMYYFIDLRTEEPTVEYWADIIVPKSEP